MQAHHCRDKFILISSPKMGSTSIEEWAARSDDIQSDDIQKSDINFETESRDIYAIWRDPFERIVTGLNTAFNLIAWNIVKEDSDDLYLEYLAQVAQFSDTLDFTGRSIVTERHGELTEVFPIAIHTRVLQDTFLTSDRINWIRLEDLSKLHLFLNNKYESNYPPIGHCNKGDLSDNPNPETTNLTSFAEFQSLIEASPHIIEAITHRSQTDFMPNNFLDFKDLISH